MTGVVGEVMEERFWSKVDKRGPDECWEWSACRDPRGYGKFRGPAGVMKAMRMAWLLASGPIPEGMCVCHKCDNPPCCNPAHLWLGTHSDNFRDMRAKGRDVAVSGFALPQTKLSDEQVAEIRRMSVEGKTVKEISARYSLDLAYTYQILSGKRRPVAASLPRPPF